MEIAAISLKAGRTILGYFRSDVSVDRKNDASPVTDADRHGEDIITSGLAQAFPEIPILAEEAASTGSFPALGLDAEGPFFLVDPLDGTKEFISGSGEFTVNIALVRKGAPVQGVVVAPALGAIYLGIAGAGAWRAEAPKCVAGDWEPIMTRRPAPTELIAVGSRSHGSDATEVFLARLPIADFLKAGSSLKFCRIAEGAADVYPRFGRTMEWDTGAGQAVLQAAGGTVLEASSWSPLSYGKAARGYDNPFFVAWGDPERAASAGDACS
ncbi:MAG: 3'(2'),5'-bisphosphate nucleotidase CysQ [Alphaproteobacteria bacterium]|nr:3'(2'),5'-bisphosphate nucleotidase CysQ [Alphaproteobacteria bacterium]